MSLTKESKQLRSRLRKMGLDVEKTGSGHWTVRDADGRRLATFPDSPGSPSFRRNVISDLRRNGVKV